MALRVRRVARRPTDGRHRGPTGRGSVPAAMIGTLATLWVGLLLGVSFLATPVKFRADSLTRPVALDVGQVTFHLFTRVEVVLLLVLAGLVAMAWRRGAVGPRTAVLVGLIAGILAAQLLWLLPQLDDRVAMIITGEEPASSPLHTVYVGAEVIKLILLSTIAVMRFRA